MAKNRVKLPTFEMETTFRERVKHWRENHKPKLNQTGVSDKLGCDRSQYGRKERGKSPYFFNEVLFLINEIPGLGISVIDTTKENPGELSPYQKHAEILSKVIEVMESDYGTTQAALSQNVDEFLEKVREKKLAELKEAEAKQKETEAEKRQIEAAKKQAAFENTISELSEKIRQLEESKHVEFDLKSSRKKPGSSA